MSHGLQSSFDILGPLIIDEGVEVAKTVCNGDAGAALFSMYPVPHGSTDKFTVKNNRRIFDDKVSQQL